MSPKRVEPERARYESLRMFEVMVANVPFGKVILDAAVLVRGAQPGEDDVVVAQYDDAPRGGG